MAKRSGFSLIEVTIAMAIFFVCMFALLSLTTLSLTSNKLTVLPDAFGQLTALTALNLLGNQLAA